MEHPSPDSGIALQPIDFRGVRLDVCPQTGGIWFDAGEIARIRNVAPHAMEEFDAQVPPGRELPTIPPGARHCPLDGTQLAPFYYSADHTVPLETCPKCGGVWADHNALDNLAAHVGRQTKNLQPTAPSYVAGHITPNAQAALAQIGMDHEAFMARAHTLTSFFQTIDRPYGYGYWRHTKWL